MLIPIVIDTSDLQSEFNISKKDIELLIDTTIKGVTLEYYRLWDQQASKGLKSTRQRYRDSLIYVDEGLMKGAVILRDQDPLVMMLEEGASEFDQKLGFAKSEKKKTKKDGLGWYLTIPMRFATPGAIAESEIFSGVLPQEIYEKVKSAETNIPISGGLRSEGLKLKDIPANFQDKSVRKPIPESKILQARKEYISKSSKFEGIVKVKDTTTGNTRGYMSFRRVSDKSDPASWIHKGFEQKHFAEKALEELDIQNVVDSQIDSFLSGYL